MKYLGLAIALVLLTAIPSAMAVTCSSPQATLTVGSGQYVKVSVTPCDKTIYQYMWDADSPIALTYLNPDSSIPTSSCAVEFFAPTVTGTECVDYYLDVDVTNKNYAGCTDTKCIKVTVCPLNCPVIDKEFCDEDYKNSLAGTPWTYTYAGQYDSSMTIQWYVNGVEKTTEANLDGAATPKIKDIVVLYSWLNHPTGPTGTDQKACTDVRFVLKDKTGKTLLDCTEQICLVFDPIASVTPSYT